MKGILAKILPSKEKRRLATASRGELAQQVTSLWQDTGQVYYLENTLKLSYQSTAGLVTIEKIPLDQISNVIDRVCAEVAGSPLARQETAGQKMTFNLSVCGVTWQRSGESTRVKSIPQAALLRSETACFSDSQAVFKHATLLEHDDLLTSAYRSGSQGVFAYHRVSIEQFTRKIREVNALVGERFGGRLGVRAENFDGVFTEHEAQQLDRLLNVLEDPSTAEAQDEKLIAPD